MVALKKQLTLFTIVSGANFLLTLVVYYSLLKAGIHYLLALCAAWIIGNIFTYILNFTWVFKPEEKLEFRRRFPKYLFANGISFALNLLLLNLIVENMNWDPFYAQIPIIPMIVIINFSTSKFWSMRAAP